MKDLGSVSRILGMDIVRNRSHKSLTLSQQGYLQKVVKLFIVNDSKVSKLPIDAHFKLRAVQANEETIERKFMREVPFSNCIGSYMYAMINTRPDIAYGVSLISKFMSKPT